MAQVYTFTAPAQPGLTPPPGVVPTFSDPFSLQPYYVLTIAGCIITTTILIAARMYTKMWIIKSTVWEDYTCCIGWVLTIRNLLQRLGVYILRAVLSILMVFSQAAFMAYLGVQMTIGKHGGGVHQWNTVFQDVQYNYQWTNYGDMAYSISLLFTKLSILLLILRIFLSVRRGLFWWLTQGLIIVNTIVYVVFFFVPIFLCSPRRKIWTPDIPGHCLNIQALYMASSVFNMISDILMLSVPFYLVWHLQMSTRRKIGVSLTFGIGTLACISSLLRLVYAVDLIKTKDYTYVKVQGSMWAFAELAFGLACSCFPILPRFYQHISSNAPYIQETLENPLREPSSKASVSAAAQQAAHWSNKGGGRGGNWIHLDDRSVPGMPERTTVDVQQRTKDEDAVEGAVEGKVGTSRGDLEYGNL